jgi:hypothetical protein
MRYKFHEQLEAVKRNPSYNLPADINQPVIDFLEKIGCDIGIEKVRFAQKNIKYRTIDIVSDEAPNAKISIQMDCGMAEGRKEYQLERRGKWTVITYDTVRNSNLDKSNPKKNEVHNANGK